MEESASTESEGWRFLVGSQKIRVKVTFLK